MLLKTMIRHVGHHLSPFLDQHLAENDQTAPLLGGALLPSMAVLRYSNRRH